MCALELVEKPEESRRETEVAGQLAEAPDSHLVHIVPFYRRPLLSSL